jgi:hypothetical protein
LREDLPAQGSLAMAFRSPRWPPALLALGAPALPFLLWPPTRRLLRRLGRRFIRQDSAALSIDPAAWHSYRLEWSRSGVVLQVDERAVLESAVVPFGPLGLVLWVDNQYAALPPGGRLGFGNLPNAQAEWIEIKDLAMRTSE